MRHRDRLHRPGQAVDVVEVHARGQQRRAGTDQGGTGRQYGDQRAALHDAGEPGEEADLGRVAVPGDPTGRPPLRSPLVTTDAVLFRLLEPSATDVRVLGSWDGWSEPGVLAAQVEPAI